MFASRLAAWKQRTVAVALAALLVSRLAAWNQLAVAAMLVAMFANRLAVWKQATATLSLRLADAKPSAVVTRVTADRAAVCWTGCSAADCTTATADVTVLVAIFASPRADWKLPVGTLAVRFAAAKSSPLAIPVATPGATARVLACCTRCSDT